MSSGETKTWNDSTSYTAAGAERNDQFVQDRGGIVVDSATIVWAVRYCIGRLSYAAKDGYELVQRCAPRLDDKAVVCLRRDIAEALAEPWPAGFSDLQEGWRRALAVLDLSAAERGL